MQLGMRRLSTGLTQRAARLKLAHMEEKKDSPEPERASTEWVIVKPDHLVYQKLQLCQYLAELSELGEEATGEEHSD